jgi:hypothetical protein
VFSLEMERNLSRLITPQIFSSAHSTSCGGAIAMISLLPALIKSPPVMFRTSPRKVLVPAMKHIVALSAAATSSLLTADDNELSRQATDPTTSLMALNFQSIYTGGFHGAGIPGEADDTWIFQLRPAKTDI